MQGVLRCNLLVFGYYKVQGTIKEEFVVIAIHVEM